MTQPFTVFERFVSQSCNDLSLTDYERLRSIGEGLLDIPEPTRLNVMSK
jgi:hypothetical protein